MVATAERMGFEVGEGAGAGRSSAAVSWCFHEELAEQLIRRMAPHVPWAVAIHSPDSPAPRADQLPDLNGVAPWVRSTGGVPEGMYTLAGLNCRMRVYRYESDGGDRFLPHYDECWPGSRLRLSADGEACLEQDGWRYSSAATAGDPHGDRWAWSATDLPNPNPHRNPTPDAAPSPDQVGDGPGLAADGAPLPERRLRGRRDRALPRSARGRAADRGRRLGLRPAGDGLDPVLRADLQVQPRARAAAGARGARGARRPVPWPQRHRDRLEIASRSPGDRTPYASAPRLAAIGATLLEGSRRGAASAPLHCASVRTRSAAGRSHHARAAVLPPPHTHTSAPKNVP